MVYTLNLKDPSSYIFIEKSRPCQDLKPGPPQYQADMLPTELSWLGSKVVFMEFWTWELQILKQMTYQCATVIPYLIRLYTFGDFRTPVCINWQEMKFLCVETLLKYTIILSSTKVLVGLSRGSEKTLIHAKGFCKKILCYKMYSSVNKLRNTDLNRLNTVVL